MTGDVVRLRVPAVPRYVRVARLAAAALATGAGFSHEEVDDLRAALDEQCSPLFGEGAAGDVDLVFDVEPGAVRVEARRSDGATVALSRQHVDR